MNHSGDANKMVSDTPRTDDAELGYGKVTTDFARRLERELNSANDRIDLLTACNADVARIAKERDEALKRIKRLEEAGEKMVDEPLRKHRRWILNQAKEAKP